MNVGLLITVTTLSLLFFSALLKERGTNEIKGVLFVLLLLFSGIIVIIIILDSSLMVLRESFIL